MKVLKFLFSAATGAWSLLAVRVPLDSVYGVRK
jgi:hypothetical protein